MVTVVVMATDEQEPKSNAMSRALRSTIGRESTTFGFSILVTVVFGLTQHLRGQPALMELFLYAGGAVLSFTLLEGILSKGFRLPMPQHRTETLALGTSLNLISVLLGMGAAFLVANFLDHPAAWIIAPFCASLIYLLAESVETAIAERILVASGDTKADEVSS